MMQAIFTIDRSLAKDRSIKPLSGCAWPWLSQGQQEVPHHSQAGSQAPPDRHQDQTSVVRRDDSPGQRVGQQPGRPPSQEEW